jgi:hypothetical protein
MLEQRTRPWSTGVYALLVGLTVSLVLLPLWGHSAGVPSEFSEVQTCPDELLGVWRVDLDARALLTVQLEVTEESSGQYVARVVGANDVDERIPVRVSDGQLRFQSTILPVAFHGELSDDDRAIGGFVYYGSAVAHTQLRAVDGGAAPTWQANWSLLGVPADRYPFDLYIVREDDGLLYGYFFFRDPRLPWLHRSGGEEHRAVVRGPL